MGYTKDPVATLDKEWQHHRREVRRLHEKLFYRPLLTAVARLPGDEARLTPEAAAQRLAALGFADPDAALRHLEALTAGVTRTANIQRQLLPAMLDWFAEAPDPDAGLFGFRRISESLGRTPWYLKTLRDEGQVAERLARLLATSRYASDLLESEPAGRPDARGGPHAARRPSRSSRRCSPRPAAATTPRRRSARSAPYAAASCSGSRPATCSGSPTSPTSARRCPGSPTPRWRRRCAVVTESVAEAKELDAPPARMAVVAMGRYGGFELSYGSDADVLFVHDAEDGVDQHEAASYAQAVANELRRLLALPGGDPPLRGRRRPAARGQAGAAGRAAWSRTRPTTRSGRRSWEAQALLRADAVVGDPDLRRRFVELIDPLRYPEAGLSDDDVVEVRRIKARVDKERLPRGADPKSHLKLGRGGLADIEWTVQLLQMRHAAARSPGCAPRGPSRRSAAAREADLLDRVGRRRAGRRLADG